MNSRLLALALTLVFGIANQVSAREVLVLRVEGLTWGEVKGLGWGQTIAPVLVRLDQINGVSKSFSNHSGTMLMIELQGNVADTGDAIQEVLKNAGRKPKLLAGSEYDAALQYETWRNASGVRILSLIEYVTLAGRWLRQPLVFVPLLAAGVYFVRRRLVKVNEVKATAADSGSS